MDIQLTKSKRGFGTLFYSNNYIIVIIYNFKGKVTDVEIEKLDSYDH